MFASPRESKCRSKTLLSAALASAPVVLALAPAPEASAAPRSWIAGDGNWSVAGNWSTSTVPQAGDEAIIVNSDIATRVVTYDYAGPQVTLSALRLSGGLSPGSSNAILHAGTNSLHANFQQIGINGRANYSQSAGFNTGSLLQVGVGTSGLGAYNLSGTARLSAGSAEIGVAGTGSFNHSGGIFSVTQDLAIGHELNSRGFYNLTGNGTFNGDRVFLGQLGAGTFNQSDGRADVNLLSLGSSGNPGAAGSGTYTLSGGELDAGRTSVGGAGPGTFIQTGGRHLVSGSLGMSIGSSFGGSGSYSLSDGTLTVHSQVFIDTNGAFNQTGGTHEARAGVDVNGSYTLSGNAKLINANAGIGVGAVGGATFTHLGGTLDIGAGPIIPGFPSTMGNLGIGGTDESAHYRLAGGTLNMFGVTTVAVFGEVGSASFEQTGGVANFNGLLFIGNLDGTTAAASTYIHSGGTLSVKPASFLAPDGSVLELDGLLLVAGGTFVSSAPSGSSFTGKFTQDGGTVSGNFRNAGTYVFKRGAFNGQMFNEGTFILDGGNFAAPGISINELGGVMEARGTLAAMLENRGVITTTGALVATQSINNLNTINVPAGTSFAPLVVDNRDRINLQGGRLLGSGSLLNRGATATSPGGVIAGGGTIDLVIHQEGGIVRADDPSVPLVITTAPVFNGNLGQFVVAPNCLMNLQADSTNPANIVLQGPGARLTGGTITNSGSITGAGRIDNAIVNSGVIRPQGGDLFLAHQDLQNRAAGQIQVGGGTVRTHNAQVSNTGVISLTGGTLDFDDTILTNPGHITGRGTLRADVINNIGTTTFTGGTSDVFADVNNSGRINLTGGAVANFHGPVSGQTGTIHVGPTSTAAFFGSFSGLNRITGSGVKDFEGTATNGAILTTTGTTIVGPAGNVTARQVRDGSLHIAGRMTIAPEGEPPSRINELHIDGSTNNWIGKLDLNDNDLIIDYDGSSPIATVRNQLRSGFAGGAWNGNGITSSAAAQSSNPRAALGYTEAAALNLTSFAGEPLDASSLVITYTVAGDANLDRIVNLQDFNRLAANFGQSGRLWIQGDFNYDGTVNLQDFNQLAGNFGRSIAGPDVTPEDWANLASAVPEPAPLLLQGVAASAAMCTRRSRRGRFAG